MTSNKNPNQTAQWVADDLTERKIGQLLRSVSDDIPDDGFTDRLLMRLEQETQPSSLTRRERFKFRLFSAVSYGLLPSLTGVWVIGQLVSGPKLDGHALMANLLERGNDYAALANELAARTIADNSVIGLSVVAAFVYLLIVVPVLGFLED